MNTGKNADLPLGLGMALMQNTDAFLYFSALDGVQQKRIIDSWETVVGKMVASYTREKYIKNQTLFVKIVNPALRQDLTMMRAQLLKRLNAQVGGMVIADIRIY